MPIAALLIALVFSAFTNDTKQIKHVDPWWYYTESSSGGEGETENYVPFDDQDGLCTDVDGVRCVIEAPVGDPGYPDLTEPVKEISFKP